MRRTHCGSADGNGDGDGDIHAALLKGSVNRKIREVHTEAMNARGRHATPRWWSFAPALIVVIPLVGFSLQEDDRRRIYTAAHQFGSNPLEAIHHAYRTIDGFLNKGNFRPVGRSLENIERIFVFASAETTGLPPHIAQGAIRLAIVSCLAIVAMLAVSAIARSARPPLGEHLAVTLYPMILGTTLVAANPSSPITRYPLLIIGSVVCILLTALVIARDDDMEPRPLSWHEPVLMALLGAVSAASYDLVYAAPPIAVAFAAARHVAAGRPISRLPRIAAFRRWTIYSGGFLAVFAPMRAVIAYRCSQRSCYSGSGVSLPGLPGEFGELAVGRALTGLPPVGWSYTSELLRLSDLEFGFTDFATNPLLVLLTTAITVLVLRITGRSIRPTRVGAAAGGKGCYPLPETDLMDGNGGVRPSAGIEAGYGHRLVPCLRLAACLGAFGAVTVLIPSAIASLSGRMQSTLPPVGMAWRETVLTQTGWSFAIAAAVLALIGTARSPRTLRVYVGFAATVLGVGLTFTLLTNTRLTYFDRTTSLSAITGEISMSVINIDHTHEGNLRRCGLIDTYTRIYPDPTRWTGGPQLRTQLDELMISLYGWPFCDPDALSDPLHLESITTIHMIQECVLDKSCVTRAQTAEFLARALELPPTPGGRHSTITAAFTDIANNPHAASIQALADAGLARGCTKTTFCPNQIVTRAQMAEFLATALELPLSAAEPPPSSTGPLPSSTPSTGYPVTTPVTFTDIADNPHAASIQALADAGVTRGCTKTTFCPDRIVTRAQMDKFLARAFGS